MIDYKALAERVAQRAIYADNNADPNNKAWAADLRAVVSLLNGMADAQPVPTAWRDPDTGELSRIGRVRWQPLYAHPAPAAPQAEPCIGNDPTCPCQDGDACHYRDAADGTKGWPVPQAGPKPTPASDDDLSVYKGMADSYRNDAQTEPKHGINWQPIETAPKDNKRPLLLARFDHRGVLSKVDFDGSWECERESWEMPQEYHFWESANGNVDEPTHWAYQPEGFAQLTKETAVPQAEPHRNQPLLDLLAVIHCDGGHHTEAVGIEQSIKDALSAVCVLKGKLAQAEPKREPLSDERITKGEYVLATKWGDGDPGDHWGVGFYDRFENGRHYVVDSAGKQIRGNGFRRVGRITADVGRWLLSAAKSLEASPPGTVNLWTMLTERANGIGGSDAE